MTPKTFADLGLSPVMLKAIATLGYEQPSPIQAETIPLILAGDDLVGQSQTGSGKTAAFGIPAVEMADPNEHAVQVLILCPTRELAVQVSEECFKFSSAKRGVKSVPIYGGQSYERQFRALQQGAQIVIGTPGRIMDHISRRTLELDKVQLVILDEADEMLDMGFREDIETILKAVPTERQLVCFSATMAKEIMNLIHQFTTEPKIVKIEHKAMTVPTVEQQYYEIRGRSKTEALTRLVDLYDIKLGVIFCNTKRMVDELTDELIARGYSADRIHGDMGQAQRDRVMNKFRKGGIEFLVATDVAARGIDVDNIEVVFNYDLPWDEEDYVHRIGRTGRAGKTGRAISLVSGRDIYKIQTIERYTKSRITRCKVPSYEEVEEKRSNLFYERIRSVLQKGEFAKDNALVERLMEQGFLSTDIACALIAELRSKEEAPAPSTGPEEPRRDRDDRFNRRDDRGPDRGGFGGDRRDDRGNDRPPFKKKFNKDFKAGGPGAPSGPGGKPWKKKKPFNPTRD